MQVTHTFDMEAAVTKLAREHHHVIIYREYLCVPPIRIRLDLVMDTELTLIEHWKPEAVKWVEQWRKEGGALVYRPKERLDDIPLCDAMLIVECPMQYESFERITRGVSREVVVYRPPTWDNHERMIDRAYPRGATYEGIRVIFETLVGRKLSLVMQDCLALTQVPIEHAAVFDSTEIEEFFDMPERQFRKAIRYNWFGYSHRYHLYDQNLEPDDTEMMWAWNLIDDAPTIADRFKAVRFNHPRVQGFRKMSKLLIRSHNVLKKPAIYIIDTRRPKQDYGRIDALSNLYRGRWMRIRDFIDNTKEYLL